MSPSAGRSTSARSGRPFDGSNRHSRRLHGLVFHRAVCLEWPCFTSAGETVKGLRFERIGKGRHYNVVFHIGSTYVPVSDESVEELKTQSLLPAERFLDLLVDRIGYSSYLKDQIRTELKSSGDPVTQLTVLQGAVREL